jgi:hypothetical protein
MRIITVLSTIISMSSPAFACEGFTAKGDFEKQSAPYNKMVQGLASSANWQKTLQGYLEKSGLPVAYGAPSKIKRYRDYALVDDPGGTRAIMFTKRIMVDPTSGLNLDEVYEVSSPEAKKAVRSWKVPYNGNGVAAIEGEELRYPAAAGPLCTEKPVSPLEYTLAIKPSGYIRVMPKAEGEGKAVEDCPAAKALFTNSAFAKCEEFTDLKTKKKRILVFNSPMT